MNQKPIIDALERIAGGLTGKIAAFAAPVGHSLTDVASNVDGSVTGTYAVTETLLRKTTVTVRDADRTAVIAVEYINLAADDAQVSSVRCFDIELAPQPMPFLAFRAAGGLADGHYPPENYRTQEVLIESLLLNCTPPGGRSSDRNVPITMVANEDGAGFWISVEWSGQWMHLLKALPNKGLEVFATVGSGVRLRPGETFRLPLVHLGFFDGGFVEGTNSVRRYIYEQVGARYLGQPVTPPVSYDHWFGIENGFTAESLQPQVERAAELGCEFFVVDAAWFAGDFPHGAGNWEVVAKDKFPGGLKPFADSVRARGMKFGLWFEPERAHRESDWAKRFPDLFIDIGRQDLHLNLAKREAQDLLIDRIGAMIADIGIEWSRWDYNIDPALYWERADPTGCIQFEYMDGLYRVLDELMTAHPTWFVETCASGGRRLDFGTMRRAHTCWFSDETMSPAICRYMQLQSASFLPGQFANSAVAVGKAAGDAGFDDHALLSRMAGALSFDGDIASWSPTLTKKMREAVDAYKTVRHLLNQDFYRLLPTPSNIADWDAGMFVSYDRSEAAVFVFRTFGGPDTKKLRLKGLAPGSYMVVDPINSGQWHVKGTDLVQEGVRVPLDPFTGMMLCLRRE